MTDKKKSKSMRGGCATKPINLCICQSCIGLPEFESDKMKEHLKEVHSIDLSTAQFDRTMLMHMDSANWYETQYQWTEKKDGGVKFQQLVRELRKEAWA